MKLAIIFIFFLFFFNILNAQVDSLKHYSLAELEHFYKTKNQPQDQLPYAIALLQKGEKELDTKDTAYAKLLFKTGVTYLNLRDWLNATNCLEKAIAIWQEKKPMHAVHTHCLNALGGVYYYQGKNKEAEQYFLQALELRKKVFGEQHSEYAISLNNLGELYRTTGNYALAEPLYQESLKIKKEIFGEQHLEYAISLNNMALLHETVGNYELAESLQYEALKIRKAVLGTEHPYYAQSLNNLAILYLDMGNYAQSEALNQEALKIRKAVLGEQHPDYAKSLYNLAVLYQNMGNFALAEPLIQQSLKINKEVWGEHHPYYTSSLNNLASVYLHMGNYAVAEPLYQEALKINKEILGEQHPEYARCLNNLAALYQNMGNHVMAESLYEQALNIKKQVLGEHHPEYATNLNSLAISRSELGDYASAEPLFQEALKITKEILGDQHPYYSVCLNNLAKLYLMMRNYTSAEPLFQEAFKTRKEILSEQHPDYAISLNNLANLYENMNEYGKAELYYSQCFVVKNANLSTNFSWLSEKGKAAYWQQEKNFYESLNNYAAKAVSSFPQAAALAYNSNLIAKGLLLESAKEVEEAVMISKDTITLHVYEELKEKINLINRLISSGTGKKEVVERYEIVADSLDKVLIGRLGQYANSKKKFQITWKEVQNALSDNEIAIEFARFLNTQDTQYYYMALLLRKGYELPKLVKLGSEKAIADVPAGKGFARLYELIWQPIDTFLQGATKVYYSPDGVLNNIAFAALCSAGTEKVVNTKNIKRGSIGISKTGVEIENCTYLSDRYTLQQLSITRYLAEGLKSAEIDNSMLVLGGVNYDEIPVAGDTIAEVQVVDFEDYALAENISRSSNNQSRMEYLPGTQTELQNVQKILHKKQWKIRAFSDKNASENTLKTEIQKESPSVLHIATHGFAFPDVQEKKKGFEEDNKIYQDADNPMARCGLLLAGANHSWTGDSKTVLSQTGEDGILTALEVSNLPLKNTKLVVLSACETGLGKIQGTEGVFGLKRGFKLALVEQIIVSLWSVPDKETMELMDIFYNDLAKTHNAVISFEKAQKEMRKKYATRPDLWAGFVLVR